jgi:hypothetical protein
MKPRDVLSDILRQGAQQMLAAAIENEVAEYIGCHAQVRDSEIPGTSMSKPLSRRSRDSFAGIPHIYSASSGSERQKFLGRLTNFDANWVSCPAFAKIGFPHSPAHRSGYWWFLGTDPR